MAEFEESLEELQGKQKLYEEQLQQVEDALKQEETEDLKRLRADLQEVIQLTKHLVEYKQQQEQQAAVAQVAAAKGAAVEKAEPASEPRERAAATDDAVTTSAPAAASAAPPATDAASKGGALVGRTCSAEYEGKRYYATIVEVKRDPKEGERVVVNFIGWGDRKSVV